MSSRCTPGSGWTCRAKRHGGMANVIAKRVEQFRLLAIAMAGPHKEIAEGCIRWLEHNPVRLLGPDAQDFFGWREAPPDPTAEKIRRFLGE